MIHNQELLDKLKQGNQAYLSAKTGPGDISAEKRRETCSHGQHPYAVVVTCADSRVIPEAVFSCGIGELFVIRVAGNVIGDQQLGSIEYATEHLGCKLVLVMGHTNCGAVGAAISGGAASFIRSLTDDIREAIGGETDDRKACCLNVQHSVRKILEGLSGTPEWDPDTDVIGAVYEIADGHVDWS